MKSQSLNSLIKDSIEGLNYDLDYRHGTIDEFNNEFETMQYPIFWTLPYAKTGGELTNNYRFYDTQRVDFFMFFKDKVENRIADREQIEWDCDEIITELVYKINTLQEDDHDVTISNITYSFEKLNTASVLAGIGGNFIISSPNDFDYCAANS